jgi:AcrR family transcriptional regulator
MELRDRIIEGSARLFRNYGIKAVTMDTIANDLGISKRTIYEVFSDKDELLIGVLQWMARQHKELLKRVLSESENSIEAIFKLLQINRDHFQNMSPAFQSDLKRFHNEVLMVKNSKCEMPDNSDNIEVIKRGIKEKLFRKDINAELVNRCFDHMGKALMNNEIYPFDQFTRFEVISNTMINYMRGISTPVGLELINKLEKEFKR